MPVERFYAGEELLALIVRDDHQVQGIEFFTSSDSSQQLGVMRRPAGYEVLPHRHNVVHRTVTQTQETLFIRRGSCRLDLYGHGAAIEASVVLHAGDIVLLAAGGHGLVMLEETEIIEVKQGPFSGDADKTRFEPEPSS